MRAFDTRFCERCRCPREFNKRRPEHLWHFGLSILTFGIWSVGWLAVIIVNRKRPWRCGICRSAFVPREMREAWTPGSSPIKLPLRQSAPRPRRM